MGVQALEASPLQAQQQLAQAQDDFANPKQTSASLEGLRLLLISNGGVCLQVRLHPRTLYVYVSGCLLLHLGTLHSSRAAC